MARQTKVAQTQNAQTPATPAITPEMLAMFQSMIAAQAAAPAAQAPAAQAPAAQAPAAQAPAPAAIAEVTAILATAKVTEVRFSAKGKPYAVVNFTNGRKGGQSVAIWLKG